MIAGGWYPLREKLPRNETRPGAAQDSSLVHKEKEDLRKQQTTSYLPPPKPVLFGNRYAPELSKILTSKTRDRQLKWSGRTPRSGRTTREDRKGGRGFRSPGEWWTPLSGRAGGEGLGGPKTEPRRFPRRGGSPGWVEWRARWRGVGPGWMSDRYHEEPEPEMEGSLGDLEGPGARTDGPLPTRPSLLCVATQLSAFTFRNLIRLGLSLEVRR